MGTSISPSVTPGPQKDPSAERNAVPRKAKVISNFSRLEGTVKSFGSSSKPLTTSMEGDHSF